MKIAILSIYPASRPFHGGQRRVDAIGRVLRAAGHSVFVIPVFFPGSYPNHDREEARTALPDHLLAGLHRAGLREDLHLHRLLGAGVPAFEATRARIDEIRPDILHLEQPWLFPLLDPLLAVLPRATRERLRIVYGSQNIESLLVPARFRDEAGALERAAACRADLVVAVSEADARVLSGWRATSGTGPVILAPNGSWPPILDPAAPRLIAEDYLLVVGSAHAPNAAGYWDVFGRIPGCVPPDARLVVVGGMANLLRDDPRYRHFRKLNDHLVRLMGVVDEATLQALLTHARGICLPINAGGGTNLKTAEALLTLKPVIALRTAFRGFEDAAALDGIYIADTENDFRACVRRLFRGNLSSRRRAEDVERYGWSATLDKLAPAYERLART